MSWGRLGLRRRGRQASPAESRSHSTYLYAPGCLRPRVVRALDGRDHRMAFVSTCARGVARCRIVAEGSTSIRPGLADSQRGGAAPAPLRSSANPSVLRLSSIWRLTTPEWTAPPGAHQTKFSDAALIVRRIWYSFASELYLRYISSHSLAADPRENDRLISLQTLR